MTKLKCIECDSENTQAHHEDYTKPLDVLWLCTVHHKRVHMKKKELELSK